MCSKVVVFGQHFGSYQFLLQGLHEVQQIFWLSSSNIIHCVRRDGQTVFAITLLWGFLHYSPNALHNIVHIGEVAAAVAVVVNLDGFATQQLVGEAEISHIRATGRAIDGEEAQACGGDIVELAVAVRHELVALLGGGIEAHGVIHIVVGGEGNFCIATVNARRAGINEMFNRIVAAGFENVIESDDIAFNINIRVLNAIAHARLGGEIYYDVKVVLFKETVDEVAVGDAALDKLIVYRLPFGRGGFQVPRVCIPSVKHRSSC